MNGTTGVVLVGAAGVCFVTAWVAATLALAGAWGSPSAARGGAGAVRLVFWVALTTGLVVQTALLAAASLERGTVAVYDQAEFLFAMSWVTVLVLAWFVRRGAPWVLPVVVLPVALLFLGAAVLAPPGSGGVRPASLTSGWLLLHILTSIVAYAAFSVTFAAAAVTLARHYRRRRLPVDADTGARPVVAASAATGRVSGTPEISGGRGASVERVGYQAAVFGFPFMTMVLFSGALWARYVWGRYWAWDPIEAWGLVTWLVYAAYLHAQYSRRWGSVGSAWLAVLGFGCVVATYLFFTHLWF